VLCSDVVGGSSRAGRSGAVAGGAPGLSLERLSFELRRDFPGLRIVVAPGICESRAAAARAGERLGARTVVVGCRRARAIPAAAVFGSATGAGESVTTMRLVNLEAHDGADPTAVAEQAAARLRASLVAALCPGAEPPLVHSSRHARGSVARRRLVDAWRPDRAGVRTAGLVELEAVARALTGDARRLGLGVVIVCPEAAPSVRLGGGSLPLEVPSLEVVTAGWLLRLLADGVDAEVLGCEDDSCAARAEALTGLRDQLVEVVGEGAGCLRPPGAEPPSAHFTLHEPEATVSAMRALGRVARSTKGGAWRIESPAASLGEVGIAAEKCSACQCCVTACHTGALRADAGRVGSLRFVFDASLCPACGRCESVCPERAVSLRRVLDSATLGPPGIPIADVKSSPRCSRCGRPTAAGLTTTVVAERLSASHPRVVDRLRNASLCGDCLLLR